MKVSNVPQDDDKVLAGKFKVVKYAVDEKGQYTTVLSVGWEAENIVLKQTWDHIEARVDAARLRVEKGRLSPIGYFMVKQMMDIKMVSGYSGINPFFVWLHLRPFFFQRLKKGKLDRYANVFRISCEELLNPFK